MPPTAEYRDYDHATDEAYVNSTWKESFLNEGRLKWMPPAVYYGRMNRLVPELLARSKVRVCHSPVDRDHIWGWSAVEEVKGDEKSEFYIHYVFVRESFRGRGYARELLKGCLQPLHITHWTKVCDWLQYDRALMYHPSHTSPRSL